MKEKIDSVKFQFAYTLVMIEGINSVGFDIIKEMHEKYKLTPDQIEIYKSLEN